ncbi:MAG: SPX domain protein involved in polyphosphate accumulation [Candidatus Paceibacteria bacterium]|jgi:SPX domain protein involved in polyphosphate accumulation
MSSRHEFKYILTRHQAATIEHFVQKIGMAKDVSQNGSYSVTSLYFDTPQFTDFHDKLGGYKKRKKLRVRTYGQWFTTEPQLMNFEIKEKYDMNIVKIKSRITHSSMLLTSQHMDALLVNTEQNKELREFKHLYYSQGYRPHIIVRYDRSAYEQTFKSKVRLTFDRNIETCQADRNMTYSSLTSVSDSVIMEIKFADSLPWWFKYITLQFELSRQPFSKYSESVDTLKKPNHIHR